MRRNTAVEINKDLPGQDLVSRGLDDLARGQSDTIGALLVAIARPRLLDLGFSLPYHFPEFPERDLYRKLGGIYGNAAHSQYNALIRRLVSFMRAMEGRRFREMSKPSQ